MVFRSVPCVAVLLLSAAGVWAQAPMIDSDRVAVWHQVQKPAPDFKPAGWVRIRLEGMGAPAAAYANGIDQFTTFTGSSVWIAVKDKHESSLNTTGLPNAFPRPRVKQLIDNDRVTTWDYTWTPGVATPMHFHDKDVVVVYFEDGALQSTTPTGEKTVNDYKKLDIRFNKRDRTHTETLVSGKQHAIMTELK